MLEALGPSFSAPHKKDRAIKDRQLNGVCKGDRTPDNCSPTFGKIPIFDAQVDSSCFCSPVSIPHSFDNIPDFPLGTSLSLSHCDSA